MLTLCNRCNKPLEKGDMVQFVCTGVYQNLPSTRAWAVAREGLEADVRSIRHVQCDEIEGD